MWFDTFCNTNTRFLGLEYVLVYDFYRIPRSLQHQPHNPNQGKIFKVDQKKPKNFLLISKSEIAPYGVLNIYQLESVDKNGNFKKISAQKYFNSESCCWWKWANHQVGWMFCVLNTKPNHPQALISICSIRNAIAHMLNTCMHAEWIVQRHNDDNGLTI